MNHDFHLAIGYFEHPKIQKLERRLGEAGVLSHIRLLRFTAQNRPDGSLADMDDEDIALAAGWRGEPNDFVATLAALRLLDGDAGIYAVHDWHEHNLWASEAPRRKEAARIAAQARWAKERARKLPRGPGAGMPEQCASDAAAMRTGSAPNAHDKREEQDSRNSTDHESHGQAAIVDFPKEPKRRAAIARKKHRDEFPPEIGALVDQLASAIERFSGEAPRITPDWYVDMDRLIRLDGRSPDDVRATIEFAFGTDFWPPNVLKPTKLRRHWDALRAQLARGQRSPKTLDTFRADRTSLEQHHQNGLAFLSLYGESP
jgi:hypothetical protein